jgi:hypothetical protein
VFFLDFSLYRTYQAVARRQRELLQPSFFPQLTLVCAFVKLKESWPA